jgi:hypothetical protein
VLIRSRDRVPRRRCLSGLNRRHAQIDRPGVGYLRLEDPPGLSPITTVGQFDTVEAAQVATDEVWAAR